MMLLHVTIDRDISKIFTCSHSMDYTEDEPEPTSNPKRSAALFLLKTREEGRLTQTTLDQVVQSTSSLCEQVASNLKSQVSEAIQKVGLTEADQKKVLDSLGCISCDPFEGLRTEYKQEKFYKENFNYLVGD